MLNFVKFRLHDKKIDGVVTERYRTAVITRIHSETCLNVTVFTDVDMDTDVTVGHLKHFPCVNQGKGELQWERQ